MIVATGQANSAHAIEGIDEECDQFGDWWCWVVSMLKKQPSSSLRSGEDGNIDTNNKHNDVPATLGAGGGGSSLMILRLVP